MVKGQSFPRLHLFDMRPQRRQQFPGRLRGTEIPDRPLPVQHHNGHIAPVHTAKNPVFLAQSAESLAERNRLIQCSPQSFCTGGNQIGIHSHLPGHGMGDHVADHHPIAFTVQPVQCPHHLIIAVDGMNVHLIAQQVAQNVGRLRDAGKSHNGVPSAIILRQFHRAQHVINRQFDVHHRNAADLANPLRRAAPGDDAVIGILGGLLDNGHAFVQVADGHIQPHIGILLRRPFHYGFHTLIGCNPQNVNPAFFHKLSLHCPAASVAE